MFEHFFCVFPFSSEKAPQDRAGQGRRMVQDSMGSATQRKAGAGAVAGASVCACKSARLGEFSKLVCFEFASVAGGAAFPSSFFGVALLSPPSFGWCFFAPSFFEAASALPHLGGGAFLLKNKLHEFKVM